jgi:pimeloyl-ACP methyl ester carboxylesterase
MTKIIILFFFLFYSFNVVAQTGFLNNDPKLAYWQIGKGKHTVIVLHGGPCVEHQYLRPEFDGLSKMARVIYYDQRGCGKSSLSDSYHWKDRTRRSKNGL